MFITFEGPEGSGKTTVSNIIVNRLEKLGYKVIKTREPGGTPIAEAIRNVILDPKNTNLDPRAEALLYAASRRQHLVEKVWPAVSEGKIVICDRFLDSSLAYQGGARNLGVDNILSVNMFATEGTFPDLTLLFDIAPEDGLKRIAANANREVNRLDLEKIDFHKKVRETFLELAEKYNERFVIVDANRPLEDVVENTWLIIKKKLGI
ncbi:MAG: dTMP kinase [Erysipelotrichales bacterium]|nr:dTMP kinase [Erysipelotrichales bacterium]